MELRPIGVLRTPFKTIAECPRNTRQLKPAPECLVEVAAEYVPGLKGLEGFSHLILVYWLHQAGPVSMRFKPPFDDEERGLFATRAPRRPNPIGLAVVAFDGFAAEGVLAGGVLAGGVLKVRYLDCLDGTPLLDIKPYLPTTDAEPGASMGWLERHATR